MQIEQDMQWTRRFSHESGLHQVAHWCSFNSLAGAPRSSGRMRSIELAGTFPSAVGTDRRAQAKSESAVLAVGCRPLVYKQQTGVDQTAAMVVCTDEAPRSISY